jgi:hypothetical protein
MKKLILKACCCLAMLQGTLAVKAQTNLSLITFNEANATHAVVGSTIHQGALISPPTIAHSSASTGAISPENNWYTYVGTIGNSSPNIYTLNLATGNILYTAPATFVSTQGVPSFKNYHYSDAVNKLVGIYSDSTSASIRSCDIQTGALTTLLSIKKANYYASTYSHVSETFYFMPRIYGDTFLYTYKPGTGAFDSVDLNLFVNPKHKTIYDLQYDDVNGVLYALTTYSDAWFSADHAVCSINLSTGELTDHYLCYSSASIGSNSYEWTLHAQNKKYLIPATSSSTGPIGNKQLIVADLAGGLADDTTFYMNGGSLAILPDGVNLTNFEYNYLTGQIFGLKYVDSLEMFPAADQPLCVVTADPAGTHNVVVWEKADNGTADSFYVYRETATNVYTHIGSVHGDSLSEYHDYNGQPGSTSYRYKIAVKDGFGQVGELSSYHNTIHVQYLGGGNISWNQYTINGTTPVTSYDVLCDSLANGNWYVMLSTTGNQTSATDVNHANHTGALYRVVANMPFTCTPGRSTNQAFSNIIAQQTVGIASVGQKPGFSVYPNPANTLVTINTANEWNGGTVVITDVAGRKILSAPVNNTTTTISTESIPAGFYTITLVTMQNGTASKALLIHK